MEESAFSESSGPSKRVAERDIHTHTDRNRERRDRQTDRLREGERYI